MIKNHSHPPRQHAFECGFSLVELMVVVAIVAILAAIAAPAMRDMIVQSRLSAQANDLIGGIQAARGEAIKRNQQVRFCRTTSATSNDCPGAGNWAFWIVINAENTILRRSSVNTELIMTSTLDQGSLTFTPSGTSNVATNKDSLTACSPTGTGKTTRLITIGIGGRTSITKNSGTCS